MLPPPLAGPGHPLSTTGSLPILSMNLSCGQRVTSGLPQMKGLAPRLVISWALKSFCANLIVDNVSLMQVIYDWSQTMQNVLHWV